MVFVTILDENDNAPVFVQLVYEATFREGPATAGSVMLTVRATDQDQGLNGTVLYHIAAGNVDSTFYINKTTGTVVTLRELDYEVSHGRYTLIITATDQCPNPSHRLQSSATVLVNVIDVNDVTPTFPRSFEGPFDITEGQPGPRVWTLRAQDEDSGPNGQVEYSIVSGDPQNEFVISPVEGELRVRRDAELDRENIAFYNITVQAKDLGMPARSSTVVVSVRVLDINDNDPILLNLPMNTSVSEGVPVSTSVSRVLAFDGDSGRNALLTFNITAGNTDNAFYINETTGVVLVNRPLDRERVSEYRLTVTVKDNPENPRIARRDSDSLLISVSDENDNRPLFTEPSYLAQIAENSPAGTPVSMLNGPILARDNDLGPNAVVTYRLLGSRLDLFTVDSRRGVVSVRGGAILDRETLSDPRLELVLIAEDVGQLNSSAALSITVLDENDNRPVFNPAVLSVRLRENSPAGVVVTQVSASDADSGANGWLTYRIEGGAQDRFVMDSSSGVLLVGNAMLDREERDSYRLIVVASDQGTPPLSGTATLSVVLEDLNDSRPEFLIPVQTVNIDESTPPGAVIAQVTATDRDLRPRLEYYIIEIQARDDTNSPVAGQQDVFGIDFHSGAVFVRSPLNRELVATFDITISVHDNASDVIEQSVSVPNGKIIANRTVDFEQVQWLNFTVRAQDQGAPPRFAELPVFLQIIDINDNNPVFSQPSYQVGSDLIRVQAVDADVGNNSLIVYRILAIRYIKLQSNDSEDVGNVFIIGETDGIVRTFDLFTAYKPGYFVVDVLASDLAGHSDTTTLGIYILRDDQRVKIVINEIPERVRQFQEEFINLLSNITGAIVNTDDVQFHVDKKGRVNFAQTDMLIHVVNKQTNRILDVERVIQMIDENMEQLRNLFRNYNVLDVQPAVSGRAPDDLTTLQMAIIILAVLLFLAAMLFIFMNWYYRTVHKRKLKAIVSGSTGNQGFMDILDMPNTNKYSFEGANPVWLDPYCRNLELAAQAEHEDDLPENLSDITDLWNSPARTHGTFGREPQASKPEDDRYLRAAIQEYDNIAKLGQIMREGPIKGSLLNVVLDDYLRLKKLFAARLVTKSTSNGDQSSVTELIQSDLDEDEEEERSPGRGGTLRFKHKLPVEFKGPDGIHTVHGSTGTLLTSDLNSLPEDDQKALVRSLEALHSESGPYSERNARTESAKSTPLHKAKEGISGISGSPLEITEL
ncbi:Cadherin-23 [Acipenser ruthenus]|uniref:Cadherin-23 n=1 Tax=Acipenser ruthenus TaxID=7906 RepID=A0A444U3N9_ACIRT|nr:Cadherin-23 [Acipenser ruthenus]